jgi:hypothetical protein
MPDAYAWAGLSYCQRDCAREHADMALVHDFPELSSNKKASVEIRPTILR